MSSVTQFLCFAEIGRHPLLTPVQELTSGREKCRGMVALTNAAGFPVAQEQLACSDLELAHPTAQGQDQMWSETCVSSSILAKRYQGRAFDLLDLIQEARSACAGPLNKYDPTVVSA